jgi:hypothetical protein
VTIPSHLLIHSVTVVRPAITQSAAYGPEYDYGVAATRHTIQAWIAQTSGTELFSETREEVTQVWTISTNDADIDNRDRIEWTGHPAGGTMTFEVAGPPAPAYSPRGLDHVEANLRIVEG